jgi:EmrB/QacA subfamily drug resistance transporter
VSLHGNRPAITAGLLLGIALGALEATVVGTAMPTVVSQLGGLDHYSWVFSAYLLTSTASLPVWGRLSDQYGRRRVFLYGIGLFLVGSVLAGAAHSMPQLVAFRAIQGLGAGALIPIALTIIGEIYTIQERARMQAVFSGVWGVASIIGPLVGGWLTDMWSWRLVFYINIPFGFASALTLLLAYPGGGLTRKASVDWAGAGFLFASVSCLLAALSAVGGDPLAWLGAAVVLGALFAVVERRAADPILPLTLFQYPIVAPALAVCFLLGVDMFGAVAFVPLFVQGVMGGSATAAGAVLTPLFLGWVVTSVISARLILHVGYRTMTRGGILLMAASFAGFALLDRGSPQARLLVIAFALGGSMGFAMLALLLSMQHAVGRSMLGLATSMNQFSRSVGAALGVSMMGAILSARLGADGAALQLGAGTTLRLDPATAASLAAALRVVFWTGAAIALAALVPASFLPPVDFHDGVPAGAGEQMLAAEMTTLEPADEPVAIGDA